LPGVFLAPHAREICAKLALMAISFDSIRSARLPDGAAHQRARAGSSAESAAGLYVHLPWCAAKCPYCDFNSFALRGALPEGDYVAALLRDLRYEADRCGQGRYASIYIGGGTPSLFTAGSIARLLDGIHAAVDVSADAEITLEANPGTIETRRFRGFRDAGVNRVSIGVQSLRDAQLARLGRVHSAAEAAAAVTAALAAGFASVNLDLMYGLPGDGPGDSLSDLRHAIALGTPHLSWYQLTLEPHTAWARRPPAGLPDDTVVEPLETAGRELLAAAGLHRYEVSAYARPGMACRHNLNYWHFGDYVGIGAGAHSKRRRTDGQGHVRYSKLRNPGSFMREAGRQACVESTDEVSEPHSIALEFLMNALRLLEGVPAGDLEARTGVEISVVAESLRQAQRQGLLASFPKRLRTTPQGLSQLNRILSLMC